ncbi:MAG TPA: ABC transporter transmembrane domain-containing protein [Verrucomicrobiales bacterium]|nr:ABC transporter transmembrane domain-containing protein [Verrucomicrobiales bacterium]
MAHDSTDNPPKSGPSLGKKESLREALALFPYLSRYRRYFIPALCAMLVTGGLVLLFPKLMGDLIGAPLNALGSGGEIDVAAVLNRRSHIALILVGVLTLQALVAYFRITWFIKAGECALADIRQDLYARLIRQPMTFFNRHRTGELSSRLASDLTLIRDTLVSTVPQFLRQSITLVGSLILIFVTSVKLSLFMLACLPVVILATAWFGRRIRSRSRLAQDLMAESHVIVEETLQGAANVKAFGNEGYETERYQQAVQRFLKIALSTARLRAAFVSFIILVLFGVITVVVWYGSGLLALPPEEGGIRSSQFISFVLYTVFLGGALGSFPEVISQLQKALGATERVRELLREAPELDLDHPSPRQAAAAQPRLRGALCFREVHFTYPSRPDVEVLRGVSFSAAAGQRVALVGPSGAGKSTVISLLLRFFEPSSGQILFDGKPSAEYDLAYLRTQLAIVPQEVLLFGGSIRENIGYGRIGASEEEIRDAARKANASDFIEKFPEQYDTLVGDRGLRLSGGQRQRIAIARAILANPAILILDEATSSLDSESEAAVQSALEDLMRDRTSIIIAHRLSTVREADQILVLNEGRVVETGTHENLSQIQGGLYWMLSKLQFAGAAA